MKMITHDDWVIWSKALIMIPCLVYLIMWGYGDSHEHYTCSLGMGLLVRVLYVDLMNATIWIVVMTLCWGYSCCDNDDVIHVDIALW